MRRVLLAPLMALILVLGTMAGAAAVEPEPLEVTGHVVDTKASYSTPHAIGDGLLWSRAVVFYEGELTIGDQTKPADVKVVLARTLNADFEGTMEGSMKWDLRAFGYGKCRGPLYVTMEMGEFDQYPTESVGSAVCGDGAVLDLELEGAYQMDGSYRLDIVVGTLTMPDQH
jgi:hypothetical protein